MDSFDIFFIFYDIINFKYTCIFINILILLTFSLIFIYVYEKVSPFLLIFKNLLNLTKFTLTVK